MQVSSAILFRVPLCNRALIEKALSQVTNMEHIFSEKSLKRGQFPGSPLVADLVTLQLFQNASLGFPWYFPYVFSCLLL